MLLNFFNASGNEYGFCEQDVVFAIIGLFRGSATIDISDPYSAGIWKRIFNVTEAKLIKAVEDVGNSAVDVKEYLTEPSSFLFVDKEDH